MERRNKPRHTGRPLVLASYWSLDSEDARPIGETHWARNILRGNCKPLDAIGTSFVQRSARTMASCIYRLYSTPFGSLR